MALLVPDDLWQAIELLLPPGRAKPKGGRPRAPDRSALAGILFVLRTGIQWHEVPAELGCCGKTCWRRLGEWHAAGVWTRLHRVLLERPNNAGQLDWSRAGLDSASLAAKKGGRSRPQPDGSRQAGHEAPLRHGRPRHAARRCPEQGQPARQHDAGGHPGRRAGRAFGRHRWVVERSFAWLARFRRLSIRYERRADLHLAFTTLACAVICLKQIRRFVPSSKPFTINALASRVSDLLTS